MTQVLNGRQQKGFLRPFRDEEGHQLGLRPDILDDVEDRLAGGTLGGDDVDLFVVNERVTQEPDPVALTDSAARAVGRLRDLVVKAKPVPNLVKKNILYQKL